MMKKLYVLRKAQSWSNLEIPQIPFPLNFSRCFGDRFLIVFESLEELKQEYPNEDYYVLKVVEEM